MIFGLFSKKYKPEAQNFSLRLLEHVDRSYKHSIQNLVQILVGCGLNENDTSTFLGYPHLKITYAMGICAEELLPARNTLGEREGERFEQAVINQLAPNMDGYTEKQISTMIENFLKIMREDPANSRLILLDIMMEVCGLKNNISFKNLCKSPIKTLAVQVTIKEGPGKFQGIMRESLQQ